MYIYMYMKRSMYIDCEEEIKTLLIYFVLKTFEIEKKILAWFLSIYSFIGH